MDKLIRGIVHFRTHELPARRDMFARLANGQSPDTLFLACADSRVVPNLLSSTEPGDLFTIRTIGNLIAPAVTEGGPKNDVSEAAAVEYALLVLGVRDVVICGHSRCGAMDATLAGMRFPAAPHLEEWLELAKPSLDRFERATYIDASLPPSDRLSQVNVLQQLDHLRSYAVVREREAEQGVRLHGWWFDVATGETHIYDSDRGGFVLLDEHEAERILSHSVPAPKLSLR
ncbi:MAG: carbonic anhydrase [Myxococcota bacterium]|nr:carbonic anhydrase [Myxococcota bacterium]